MKYFRSLLLCLLFYMAWTGTAHSQPPKRDTITVARDGSGDFRNIQDAFTAIDNLSNPPDVLYIKNGLYKEKVVVPATLKNLRIVGQDMMRTVITWDDHANLPGYGTFNSYTLKVLGSNLSFSNLTVENGAGPIGQAVALHTEGDRLVFTGCRLLGNQDTVYTGGGGNRVVFAGCHIEGTTDFLFGAATCWFEECDLICKADSYITAASTPQDQPYGYIFDRCRIALADGVGRVYLGRPWRPWAMVVFMNCYLPEGIVPEGWHNWGKPENEATARYFEYNNSGPRAELSGRVPWSRRLTAAGAEALTLKTVMAGSDGWIPQLPDIK